MTYPSIDTIVYILATAVLVLILGSLLAPLLWSMWDDRQRRRRGGYLR